MERNQTLSAGMSGAAMGSAGQQPALQARVESAELHLRGIREARERLDNALNRLRTPQVRAAEDRAGPGNMAGHPVALSLERRLEMLDMAIKSEAHELHQLANSFDQAV